MSTETIRCIHGLEYDTCSLCQDKTVEYIQKDVEKCTKSFGWRTELGNLEKKEFDEEIDHDFDIEVDTDFD